MHEVRVPRLNPNEDELLLTHVRVSEGEWVDVGRELFVLESSKAVFSVVAEVAGYMRGMSSKAGQAVRVGVRLCVIGETIEAGPGEVSEAIGTRVSGHAEPRRGLTAKERLTARASAAGASAGRAPTNPSGRAATREIEPADTLSWVREARVALVALSTGEESVVKTYTALPALGEADAYRDTGLYVGRDAKLGAGSIIRARRLFLGPGTRIGERCSIDADSIYIGAATKVGSDIRMESGEIIFGEGVVVGDQVLVDLSGGRSNSSRLLVGEGSLIASRTLINTAREVVLERVSAISPGAMLFTHGFWQSVLEGYSVAFRGIRICENAWVGAGCQVFPGVTVGLGSVVMSNSTVIDDVPPFTLVGGVPARMIRSHIRRDVDRSEQTRTLLRLLVEFARELETKKCVVDGPSEEGVLSITLPEGQKRTLVLVASAPPPRALPPDSVCIVFGHDVQAGEGGSTFDVVNKRFHGVEDRLTHELRNFLRRRGIRFEPFAWDSDFTRGL